MLPTLLHCIERPLLERKYDNVLQENWKIYSILDMGMVWGEHKEDFPGTAASSYKK